MDDNSWQDLHPKSWTKNQVHQWLLWSIQEYALSDFSVASFNMNGKALCVLTKDNFFERVPHSGDVLYNTLVTRMVEHEEQHPEPLDLRRRRGLVTMTTNHQCPCDDVDCRQRLPLPPHGYHYVVEHPHLLPNTPNSPVTVASPYVSKMVSPHVSPVTSPHVSPATSPYGNPNDARFHNTDDIKPLDLRSLAMVQESEQSRFPTPPHSACEVQDSGAPSDQLLTETAGENREGGAFQSPKIEQPLTDKIEYPAGPPDVTSIMATPRECVLGLLNDPIQLGTVTTTNSDCRLLWEFLHELLKDEKYARFLRWENKERYIFRILSPNGLARLWGRQKNRTNMTYEKLSRALRYYYKMHIIAKVPGKRLTYKFLVPPGQIKKGVRGAKPGVPHIRRKQRKTDTDNVHSKDNSTSSNNCGDANKHSKSSKREKSKLLLSPSVPVRKLLAKSRQEQAVVIPPAMVPTAEERTREQEQQQQQPTQDDAQRHQTPSESPRKRQTRPRSKEPKKRIVLTTQLAINNHEQQVEHLAEQFPKTSLLLTRTPSRPNVTADGHNRHIPIPVVVCENRSSPHYEDVSDEETSGNEHQFQQHSTGHAHSGLGDSAFGWGNPGLFASSIPAKPLLYTM